MFRRPGRKGAKLLYLFRRSFKLFFYDVDEKKYGVGVISKEFARNVLKVKTVQDKMESEDM